jgi:hypothetical protein
VLVVTLLAEVDLADVADALADDLGRDADRRIAGLVEPARRALRIRPTDALKEA